MSVDTRTPRTPTGGSSSGYDDQPALSTVKVPSDPAQVSGNHLSFRVQLARPPRAARRIAVAADTAQLPTVPGAARRRPVVWSGRTEPGDAAPTQLLDAVRESGVTTATRAVGGDVGATQVLPRVGVGAPPMIGQRGPIGPEDSTQLLSTVRPSMADDGEPPYEHGEFDEEFDAPRGGRQGNDPVKHAYYPGRRMNLGVVLLPLRVFLGLISICAGMGKLCDPVYFDGGKRGSMVTWLTALHPWSAAAPLRAFALSHPVGSGLTVAFLQIVVGVLTIFGLWQRLAAGIGMLLSAALLVTVTWRTVPVYAAPDIIYLAAWSPLVIAGAPFYSVDGRLAGEAWRRLGPRAGLWELRRRVLRRGTVMATVLIGASLITGSVLGGAVRSSQNAPVPGPAAPPANSLPGSPLPMRPSTTPRGSHGPSSGATPKPGAGGHRTAAPTPSATAPRGTAKSPAGSTAATGGRPGSSSPHSAPQTPHHQPAAPAAPHHNSSGGSAASGGTGGGSSGGTGGGSDSAGSGGGALGGLLG
ncbi:DoxX family protein [Streptomyces orinoci]|uniref:DoxX family membrane protein n=1 Tax=Streptomyces orinoci TaxID=67339 RepID=A0ABV3JTR1_STRON|nr:DoxX family protein [Streptomyces orinoci]